MSTTTELTQPVDLLAEVADALGDPARHSLAELLDLCDRVETALAESKGRADQAKAAALSPTLTFEAAQEKRQQAERLEHETLRLAFALDQIGSLLPDRTSLHAEAERLAAYEAASTARDKIVDAFKFTYPKMVAELTTLIREALAADAMVDAANANLPKGKARLERADGLVRGFQDHAEPGAPIDRRVVRIAQAVLPHPTEPDQLAWPPGYIHHRDRDDLTWPHAHIITEAKKSQRG